MLLSETLDTTVYSLAALHGLIAAGMSLNREASAGRHAATGSGGTSASTGAAADDG
jgi:hypothetical protein